MASNCYSSAVSTVFTPTDIATPFLSVSSVTTTTDVLITSSTTVTDLLGGTSVSTNVVTSASTIVRPTTAVFTSTSTTSLPVSTIFSTFCSSSSSSSSSSASPSSSPSTSSRSSSSTPSSSTVSSTSSLSSSSSTIFSSSTVSSGPSSLSVSTVPVTTVVVSPSSSSSGAAVAPDTASKSSVPVGAIVGGVLGGLALLAAASIILYKCCVGGAADRKRTSRPLSPGFFGDKYSPFDGGKRSSDDRGGPESVYGGSDGGRSARAPSAAAYAAATRRPSRRESHRSSLSRDMSSASRANGTTDQNRRLSSRRASSFADAPPSTAGIAGVGAGALQRQSTVQAAATPPGLGKPMPTRRASGRFSIASDIPDGRTFAPAARGVEDTLNPTTAASRDVGALGRLGSRRRNGGLSRAPSSGAATARSMPRLQPVEALARDSRHANRGGLRVMNEEPEDEEPPMTWAGERTATGAAAYRTDAQGDAGGYRRADYDPHSLRPLSPASASTAREPRPASPRQEPISEASITSRRQSLTEEALQARNQADLERQNGAGDGQSLRRWLGFGLGAPSRGPPSYRTHA